MSSISSRRVRLSDIEPTPWKNGGGVTREIATGGAPEPGAGWGWRVSLAEVTQDGPFSSFPDTDRVIAVIEGAGMNLLSPDGTVLALEPYRPVPFAGEAALSARLRQGPVRDLNVMVRRGRYAAEMAFCEEPHEVTLDLTPGDCLLIHTLAGRCAIRVEGNQPSNLLAGEVLVQEGAGRVVYELAPGGHAAVIHITRLQSP